MKEIVAKFEDYNGVFMFSIKVDGKCIVPNPDALPVDLTEKERTICKGIINTYKEVSK
jgi:hypothetical protein